MIFETDVDPKQYVKEHGLSMETDKELLDTVIRQVLSDNPKAVEELKSGKEKVLGFLTGQVMRAMKGKADAAGIKERIRNLCS